MGIDRIEALRQMAEADPSNCFVRYGLAQEYFKAADYEQAIASYREILRINPDYQAAYYHAGKAYEKSGRAGDAREIYQTGIETARRNGDAHALSELEAAVADLG